MIRRRSIIAILVLFGPTAPLPEGPLAQEIAPTLAAQASTRSGVSTQQEAGASRDARAEATDPNGPPDTIRTHVASFSNVGESPADAWIGAGIAETLRSDLASLIGFSVVGTPGAPEATWIVSGDYRRIDDNIVIAASITDARTQTILDTVRINGPTTSLFALQDQLSRQVLGALVRVLQARSDYLLAASRGAPAMDGGVEARPTGDVPTTEPAPGRPPTATPPASLTSTGSEREPAVRTAVESVTEGPTVGGFNATPTVGIDGPPPPEPPATIRRNAAGQATVRAVRISAPIQLDGNLNEEIYGVVPPVSNFLQQEPNGGEPATERTEAWVFFDEQNVYVSARLWDSAPESEWIANEMQRDSFQLINNDTFSFAFDTFYDRRNGVAFMVNPIGGFFDFQLTDEGNPNSDWNPIWDSRTGRFEGGWTVEAQVPFKSLRFDPGATQLWGLQLGRRIRWKNEQVYLTPVPISGGPGLFRLSAAGTLSGIQVPPGNRTFEIKPYAIGSVATDNIAVPRVSNARDGDFGVDVKYGVTENLTVDFTYNTDFAQVEVDEQQVNLTRFSLFFPEKREFFLEGRGIFDFARGVSFGGGGGPGGGGRRAGGLTGGGDVPTIFFSRQIGLGAGQTIPILGGGRLNGKVGQFSVGALSIQTDDKLVGAESSTNFTVLRVSRDILRRSRIGAIFTGRSVATAADAGVGSNQVYGLDAAFSFYDNVNVNGYWAKSQTPDLKGKDQSYQAAFTYNGDLYALQVDHALVGDNFNPEVGFLRRDNFRRTFVAGKYSPRPRGIQAVRQFTWGGSLDYIESGEGHLETRLAQANFLTSFENSDQLSMDVQQSYELLVDPFDIATDVAIPTGGYDFLDFFTSYSMGAQRRVSGTVTFQRGGFFSGDITAVGYRTGRIEVTPQLSVEPGFSVNRIDLPEGLFTAKLTTARVTYSLTPRTFFSGLLQYNSGRNSLSSNLRLRWEYQPGSELFVVYNDQRDTEFRGAPLLENRAFVIKFTRLFRY